MAYFTRLPADARCTLIANINLISDIPTERFKADMELEWRNVCATPQNIAADTKDQLRFNRTTEETIATLQETSGSFDNILQQLREKAQRN